MEEKPTQVQWFEQVMSSHQDHSRRERPKQTRNDPDAIHVGDVFMVPASLVSTPLDLVVLSTRVGHGLVRVAPCIAHGHPGTRDVLVRTEFYRGIVFSSCAVVLPRSLLERSDWRAQVPEQQLFDYSYENDEMEMAERRFTEGDEFHLEILTEVQHALWGFVSLSVSNDDGKSIDSYDARDFQANRAANARERIWRSDRFMKATPSMGLDISIEVLEKQDQTQNRLILHWRMKEGTSPKHFIWSVFEMLEGEVIRALYMLSFEARPETSGRELIALKRLGGALRGRDIRFNIQEC